MHAFSYRRFFLALLSIAVYGVCCQPSSAAGWKLVFQDEFDGTTLDLNKWSTRHIYENETLDHFNDELQRYRDTHKISDGVLSLIASKAEDGLFSSGMIRSYQTFYYGYFEARVFLPKGKGIWPAFWLVGDYDSEGKTWHPPEIDIFEYVDNGVEDRDNMLHSTPLDSTGAGSFSFMGPSFRLRYREMYAAKPLNESWHTAGLVWTPSGVSFFWDGQRIYTRSYSWLRSDGQLGPPAQVILNFAIGGTWAGRHGIDDKAFPQAFKIDYVHVCQFTSSSEGGQLCGESKQTPSPVEFGYKSDFDDMAKPSFSPVKSAETGEPINQGAEPTGNTIAIDIPLQLPENFPDRRTVEISVIDNVTRSTVTSVSRDVHQSEGSGTARDFKVSLPIPSDRGGDYSIEGRITAEIDTKDGMENRDIPVFCKTGVPQPIKARSCRLLLVHHN
jgi:beta-glucanase (GH16 family)